MKLYSTDNNNYKLYEGNMLDMLQVIEPNSVGSIVTDPPYELNFMGKGWDNSGIAFNSDSWKKCYEVLKPGGYLLAFGGSRTFHRIACAIEDAGFEIRDTIMWIYGSGFPKSMNIGLAIDKKNGVESPVVGQNEQILKKQAKDLKVGHRTIQDSFNQGDPERNNGFKTVSAEIREAQNEWKGWGTALKPSFEPIIVARKPFKGSLVDNVLNWGVGGINIDECRVGTDIIKGGTTPDFRDVGKKSKEAVGVDKLSFGQVENAKRISLEDHMGRFPANTILTYDESDYEEVCGGFPQSKGASSQNNFSGGHIYRGQSLQESNTNLEGYREWYNDDGSAARYFYCAKASKRDRNEGCEQTSKNTHPTVKPTSLIQYLIKLVTPRGETVLDPFNGSGSTGKATMYENKDRQADYKYIGIELTPEYLPIAKARIEYAIGDDTPILEFNKTAKPKTSTGVEPVVEHNVDKMKKLF